MFDLRERFVKEGRDLYLKEEDLIRALECIDEIARDAKFRYLRLMNMEVRTCGEFLHGIKWSIEFDMTEYQWRAFIALLKDSGHEIIIGESGRHYLR